ncbi:MAG: hypothetical protein M3068_08385 [Gemmatimonadota bacterium]|nr:hypothetical protein [Gemmatimonadota bacterium]
MTRSIRCALLIAMGAALGGVTQSALAQSATASPAAGPTLAGASVAFRVPAARDSAPITAPPSAASQFGRGEKLMLFGGAVLLTGLVIGGGAGNAVAVAGAVVGLYGLYIYLNPMTVPPEGSYSAGARP